MAKRRDKARRATHRVLIVDDHPVMRRGIRDIVGEDSELEICGEAADAADALRLLRSADPDVAIVDISLARGSGLELLKQIRSCHPEVKTLVLSMHDETVFAERVLRAGALGYVNKAEPGENLLAAVHKVLRGEIALSPAMTDRLLRSAVSSKQPKQLGVERLSDRELEVFELIGQGRATGQIADRLGVSVKTVETHCQNIKQKLGADSINELRRQAALFVEKSG